ncbi:MAG: cytochrome c biogenesis protein ResB [Elusimicrobia bacterium]|nr:cytochrome c biogenesis protein ResB [Elusimicrobiota bacterium]MBK7207981.1 cytochrome c biogenesis protein ResB [Elusimicrobiota bacterium]MBK7544756.1 cytochrome c biogenesis protein ResB [Elusimicrobiota bacterium]MBK7574269.1 cytochrome c biogenesis protein ResB [Elusimicrobiota bacterium]MBK7688367.1 cytochrome c biogenesis protein ResB [Elusimicrobiota bacterium]
MMMVLVFFGTIHQVQLGTWLAQKKYFSSWFLYFHTEGGFKFPIFPGGYTVGGLWLVNLLVSHIDPTRWDRRRLGLLLTHAGLFVLLLGQGITQMTAVESHLDVEEGQTKSYSENYREKELALIDETEAAQDTVHVIPAALLAQEKELKHPGLPFAINVKRFFPNALLGRGSGENLATQGVGVNVTAREIPVVTADDQDNATSAYVEFRADGQSLGTWLVSNALGAPQTVVHAGRTYRLELRPTRYYHPFSLTLKDFKHDRYPGTNIPKNFSSLLRLVDPEKGEDRDVLIYMNNPLRYRGLTFFQQSFGKDDTLSVLQVVANPVWVTPYLACLLVSLGLLWHFGISLARFRRGKP